MPQSAQLPAESPTPSAKRVRSRPLPPGTVLPSGKTVIHATHEYGENSLQVDPKTGRVTAADPPANT
jgi:hypothetical protein